LKNFFYVITLSLYLPLMSNAAQFSGCSDPNYIAYVDKRLAFYEKIERERYQKAKSELQLPFEELGWAEKELYLFGNTILSTRFDTKHIAIKHIREYESSSSIFFSNGDAIHNTKIARGWLALIQGKEDEAIKFLMASTKTRGSPVLNSFGPDVTLIRELYQRGRKMAVLKYLKAVQSFWNIESALEYIRVWEAMIASDCPIQFQFYDTTSIAELNLNYETGNSKAAKH